MLAATPILLGLLIKVVPSPQGLAGRDNADAISLLLVLTVGACLAGAANSVRELVKERPIYTRERAAGLSAGAYFLSKVLILGVISIVQAVVMLAIGLTARPLPARGAFLTHLPLAELLIAVAGLSIASMTLGLLISAAVNSSDKTLPLLVVLVIGQVPGASAASGAAVQPDPLWNHTASAWLTDMGAMLALALVSVVPPFASASRRRGPGAAAGQIASPPAEFALLTWRRLSKMGPAKRR